MRVKRQHNEEQADESWLLPYSDMLTLLLALFIVMFAISKVDSEKFKQISQKFNMVFTGGKVALQSNDEGISSETKGMAEQDAMTKIKNSLEKDIKDDGYEDKIKIDLTGEGLNISIQDTLVFNSGEADILSDFYPVIIKISSMIKDLDNEIRISGHTDNVPIKNSKFRSNWDLSYMRAANFMNFLVDEGHISPDKFSIQSYGEYRPKYDNSTELGRTKNRSVDLLIVRKYAISTKDAN